MAPRVLGDNFVYPIHNFVTFASSCLAKRRLTYPEPPVSGVKLLCF